MDEVTKATSAENQERQLTDKELEAILKQSEGKTDFHRSHLMNSHHQPTRNGLMRATLL